MKLWVVEQIINSDGAINRYEIFTNKDDAYKYLESKTETDIYYYDIEEYTTGEVI